MANIKLINYIEKAKRDLRQQLKINGYSENFGQKELRQAQNLEEGKAMTEQKRTLQENKSETEAA